MPIERALLRFEFPLAAVQAQGVKGDILGHPNDKRLLDHADDRYARRQIRIVEQGSDTGTEREDILKVREAPLQFSTRRIPNKGISHVGVVAGLVPMTQWDLRDLAPEMARPFIPSIGSGIQDKGHRPAPSSIR